MANPSLSVNESSSGETKQFSGLMSRCTRPMLCTTPTAFASSSVKRLARFLHRALFRLFRSASVPRSHSSVTMHTCGVRSKKPTTRSTFSDAHFLFGCGVICQHEMSVFLVG